MRSQLDGAKKLTDSVIDKLTSYYGMAIRKNINTDEETMRRAVWASFLHSSGNRDSSHMFCPKGKESWCWWRVAQAERKTVQKTPLLSGIPFEKMNVIQSLYADLASPELLQKCLKGRTQNVNESLHGRVWKKISKDKYAGLFRTTFACEATILNHNFKKDLHFLSSLGFPVSQHSLDVLHRQDGVTKRSMRQSSTPRKRRKVVETKADDSYSSGAH
ncbi:hypothetical protein Pcinc_004960 [Petrolisthes cinctipes]|uniref:Uncharacterized protein n=1 Tax=Petrolisthes cinctipes TaxID=88211 RepID=A0AAE1KZM2_PETCI|nr:hypothetical protein Pcinc_004960 [Petrolisthes cinctipes]